MELEGRQHVAIVFCFFLIIWPFNESLLIILGQIEDQGKENVNMLTGIYYRRASSGE